jgi:hypothetical protein
MGRLTEFDLRTWVRAGIPIAGRSDGNGLTFTLSANRLAAWVLRYRFAGKRRELTIGRYPGVSLKQARDLAAQARSMFALGVDVAAAKQIEKRQNPPMKKEPRVICAPLKSITEAASLLSSLEKRRVSRVLVTVEFEEGAYEHTD